MPNATGLLAIAAGLAVAACADAPPLSGDVDDGVNVAVTGLALPGVTNAELRLTIANGAGQVVMETIVSTRDYGDGDGSLVYVAPCDASDNDNTVTVELLALYGGASGDAVLDPGGYDNPGPLTRSFECVENRDVLVAFNVTILRAAGQGFFDVTVNFDEIYCSAKLDCVDALLTDPNGDRNTTLVLGFTCTAGAEELDTWLYLDDLVLSCAEGNVTLDPASGPGRVDAHLEVEGDNPLYGAMVFQGEQQLGFPARFWNVALGFFGGSDCRFTTRGTAAGAPFEGGATPADTSWPLIDWNVTVSDADGALVCGQHPVGGGNGVGVVYTNVTEPHAFAHVYGPE